MGIISSLYIDNCVTPNGKLDEQQRRLSRGRLTSISSNKGQDIADIRRSQIQGGFRSDPSLTASSKSSLKSIFDNARGEKSKTDMKRFSRAQPLHPNWGRDLRQSTGEALNRRSYSNHLRTAVESQDQRKSQSPISRASHFTTNQLTVEDARVSPTNRRTSSARNSVRKSTGRKTIMGGRKSSRQTTEEFDIDKSLQELKEKIKKLESEDKNDITYG